MPKEDVTVTRGASSRTKLRESFDEAARNFTDLFVGKSVQGAPHAATVSATLTAAQLLTRIITVNQGGAAASELTLPLATAMDTGFSDAGADGAFDFNVINISTVAAEDATILTNTGWTLVGEMPTVLVRRGIFEPVGPALALGPFIGSPDVDWSRRVAFLGNARRNSRVDRGDARPE
jgi:hypothetical protein